MERLPMKNNVGGINDLLKATGSVKWEILRADGSLETYVDNNLVMNVGKAHIAELLTDSSSPAEVNRMALGTGTTPPDASQTQLVTEISRKLVTSRTQISNAVQYVAEWPAGDATSTSPPITEAGLFNAASGGNMFARTTFDGKAKGPGDALTLTWTVTIS